MLDQRTGKVLASQNDQQMFDPGSTMKLYSVSTGLRLYGTRYRFRTPVYREGTVADGTLTGNLVLVGSSDLTFGLRELPGGRLAYENLPAADHSYADQLPGCVLPHGNPWLAMRQLAQRVRASGITRINGNVVIDDRLFRSYDFPDGEVSPIWFNENLVDLLVKPGRVGARGHDRSAAGHADLHRHRPGQHRRPRAGDDAERDRTHARASRRRRSDRRRRRAGAARLGGRSSVAVRADRVHRGAAPRRCHRHRADDRYQPTGLLPARGSYQHADLVGVHVSDPISQYAKLILKVSYNRGADLMACLAAAKLGSRNCLTGIKAEVTTATGLGVPRNGLFPRTAPDQMTRDAPAPRRSRSCSAA